MKRSDLKISAERLFEASEAVLQAVKEAINSGLAGEKNRAPYPPDLMGSLHQPACLSHFTRSEVEEGTSFLIRLGILELPRA